MGMRMRTDTWVLALTILIILGIVLTIKTIQATTPYYIEYFKNLTCSYKALLMGNFKTYTTCTINALHIIWNALEATPKVLAQGLGW